METYRKILTQYWGYTGFRSLQEEIIHSVMQDRDTLALLPTGGGKSITFQVPGLARDGICLVVTPLISLMQDQVENLKKRNIRAVAIHSGLSRFELDVALDNCIYGDYKFLYLSPERLSTDIFLKRLESMKVNLIAVDEAHCISQWGFDFRPSYLQIAKIREYLPGVPVLALTATATPTVAEDIQERLLFREKNIIRQTFERKNLVYLVRKTEDKTSYLLRVLNKQAGSGIIYVRNRKNTREIAEFLTRQGISAQFYHAGLDQKDRKARQEEWTGERSESWWQPMRSGMGIDKPDVRVVVHMDLPDSPEAYFQEAGRAGRDGKKAFAILLYQPADKLGIEKSHTVRFPEIEVIRKVYQALGNYLEVVPGSGKNQVFDFDLMDFCSKFSFHSLVAFHALKHLERAGYLELTEDIDLPARVHFRVDRDELYKFQIVNESYDGVIKLILRVYSGMFSDFVRIDEYNLAAKAKVPVQTIITVLSTLHNMGILYYIKPKKTPQIIFTAERLTDKSLLFPKKEYEEQEALTRTRMETMIHYATEDHRCRSQMLLMYFGEKDPFRCGQCDVCLESEGKSMNRYDYDVMSAQIRGIVQSEPVALQDLTDKIQADPDKITLVLDDMFEKKWITWSGGFLKWIGEKKDKTDIFGPVNHELLMNFASTIEPDELNTLPLRSFGGSIHVVTNTQEAAEAVRRLSFSTIVGFDTETRPTFKKGKLNPVSLLQLATREEAYLFRMNKLGYHRGLEQLLVQESPLKIGAAIHEDIRALKVLYPQQTNGFIDLQDIVKNYGIENIGVKKMAAIVLGFRISKSQQLSNWEAENLTEAQMVYAATDAWVSLEIYLKLIQNGKL